MIDMERLALMKNAMNSLGGTSSRDDWERAFLLFLTLYREALKDHTGLTDRDFILTEISKIVLT